VSARIASLERQSWVERQTTAAAFTCLLGGAFGIHAFLVARQAILANAWLLLVVLLAFMAAAMTFNTRLASALKRPAVSLVVFGTLPLIDFFSALIRSGVQPGIFTYLYKFAPYLTVFYWIAVVQRGGVKPLASAVKFYAAVISIRQISVFFLPGILGQRVQDSVYDGTFVYALVGDVPRVFGPGAMLLTLAAYLYVGDWLRGRLTSAGFIGFALAVGASATTLTRGTIAVLVLGIAVTLVAGRRESRRSGRVTLSAMICLLTIGALLALTRSGSMDAVASSAGDRLSLDTTTFNWRYSQIERAFLRSDGSPAALLFGVGTHTFISNDPKDHHLQVNELHFSYVSILWTFGMAGLALLLGAIVPALRTGWKMVRASPRTLEWFIGLCMFIVLGIYTPTFTQADSALGLTLCIAAMLGSTARQPRGRVVLVRCARETNRVAPVAMSEKETAALHE